MNIQNLPRSQAFGFTKQKNLEMQDLLLRDVRKLKKTFLSQYRMIKECSACRFFKQTPLANRANTVSERSLLFSKRVIHYNFSISFAERPVDLMMVAVSTPQFFKLRAMSYFSSARPFASPLASPFFSAVSMTLNQSR